MPSTPGKVALTIYYEQDPKVKKQLEARNTLTQNQLLQYWMGIMQCDTAVGSESNDVREAADTNNNRAWGDENSQ